RAGVAPGAAVRALLHHRGEGHGARPVPRARAVRRQPGDARVRERHARRAFPHPVPGGTRRLKRAAAHVLVVDDEPDIRELLELVRAALSLPDRGEAPARDQRLHGRLLGESAPLVQVREMIAKLARTQAPVYISGESGTGKELAARLIHENGARRERPFIPVNCGAIPENLMESEFFGYKKGAFTGAAEDREGFFQAANGGTLFLDEVADLPLPMQVKLLRAIQEKRVRKVGAPQEDPVDVRIICATHQK